MSNIKTVGIIAEYNPFHNGHRYQIEYAKKVLKSDKIIVAMSGAFTQRGLPAICGQAVRADAACCAGADFVAEMPVCVSVADTPMFAQGAVDILYRIGCGSIVFGSENGDIQLLRAAAETMLSPEFERRYTEYLKKSVDSPTARERAVGGLMGISNPSFINKPNNLLGVYYICAVLRRGYDIKAFTHQRKGQGYFDKSLPENDEFASASAVRKLLLSKDVPLDALKKYVPDGMLRELMRLKQSGVLLDISDFEQEIVSSILSCSREKWAGICEAPPRETVPYDVVVSVAERTGSYSEIRRKFLEYVTPLRADRMIGWLLLDQRRLTMSDFLKSEHIGYRILSCGNYKGFPKPPDIPLLEAEWNAVDSLCRNKIAEKMQ